MKTALIVLANGFEDIEAVAVIDILRRGEVNAATASIGDDLTVTSAHGIRMQADLPFNEAAGEAWDAIILPGGGEGTQNLMECEALHERLRAQKEAGGLVCAICAAPMVLEAAGVLTDEDVTCYPTCVEAMNRPVSDMPAIADGQIVTGQGPGAAITFGLAVLKELTDDDTALAVAEGMVAVL